VEHTLDQRALEPLVTLPADSVVPPLPPCLRTALMSVTAGQFYKIYVGTNDGTIGNNNGGAVDLSGAADGNPYYGGIGGEATDIRLDSNQALSARLVTAAGKHLIY
jgi:hypothetical protein